MSAYTFRERPRAHPIALDIDELESDSDSHSTSDSATDESDGEVDLEDHSVTRLLGEKDSFEIAETDEYSFQMWVEIDGEELKVYSQDEEIANGCQGWIVSEAGKVCISFLGTCARSDRTESSRLYFPLSAIYGQRACETQD
jgi:hypothetical protein